MYERVHRWLHGGMIGVLNCVMVMVDGCLLLNKMMVSMYDWIILDKNDDSSRWGVQGCC